MELSPLQEQGVEWLRGMDRRYLADPPGFGKTRQLLAAVGEVPTVVVCPAAIRDAEVWQTEAAVTGWGGTLKVISYHQLAQKKAAFDPLQYQAIIFDEAHWLKNRKVSWGLPGLKASKLIPKTYMGSGTPTPNDASELWGQLRMIRHDIPAFWRWADGNTKPGADGWFHISEKRNKRGDLLSSFVISGHLQACVDAGSCVNAQRDREGNLMPVTAVDCEHWAEFRRMEQEGYMLGRDEELLDLPEMSGYDTPLWTPMKPAQKKLYNDLKADFIASLPEHDIELEAISSSQQFAQLWQLSTGASSVDPEQDPDDKLSGKWPLMAELIEDRKNPVLVGTYFKNSAKAMVRLCERLGVRYTTFGAATTPPARKEAVRAFQAGELDVMIGSIPVIGEGLTLTAADSVLLAERMWTPDKNAQVVRRVRRRGQTKPVGVRQLVTPDTIDEGQWEVLKMKRDRISRVDVLALLSGRAQEIEYV
jgi:SNF2 family DNA or RNA helicase